MLNERNLISEIKVPTSVMDDPIEKICLNSASGKRQGASNCDSENASLRLYNPNPNSLCYEYTTN